jgi:ornithine cyclodeaminase/alanine dehydrogenase-like protein (mu-crystallin family)
MLLLSKSDLSKLAALAEYQQAVAEGFRLHAASRVKTPPPMELPAAAGAFHIKGAVADAPDTRLAVVKINGNFPKNPERFGLPTIQGALVLFDAVSGAPLAVLDSGEVTLRRTAAASAVAVDLLASRTADTLFIWGCGVQGRAHVEAIAPLRRFSRLFFYDIDAARAQRLAGEFGSMAMAVDEPARAALESDVIVTTTAAQSPLPLPHKLAPGAFVAAVGADNPLKNEIPPAVMATSAVITDVTDQCALMGDLRTAIAAGAVRREDVRAELGEVVTGAKPGRLSQAETVVFDSTGAAFEDLAVAAMLFERAKAEGIGAWIDLQQ